VAHSPIDRSQDICEPMEIPMPTTSIPGGSNHNVTVYGSGTVIAGGGNDSIRIGGSGAVIVGNGRDMITVQGNASVHAGSGNDLISIGGIGAVSVGGGNDTLTLSRGGEFAESGLKGHDTINLGAGNDTVYEQGYAVIQGGWTLTAGGPYRPEGIARDTFMARPSEQGRFGHLPVQRGPFAYNEFGGATVAGGELKVIHSNGLTEDIAVSGRMTLLGGASTEFIGGSGSTVMRGGLGNDTFVGGSGHDTMVGGSGHNLFEFLASEHGGQHVITNFVSTDQLNVEGHSLAYLLTHNEVTMRDGNTYISVDGGKTTIELQGVTESDPTKLHYPLDPHYPADKF
jgi:Ca2+-binding RTX toxin-like protein